MEAYAQSDVDVPGLRADEMSPLTPYRVAYNAPHILKSTFELRI